MISMEYFLLSSSSTSLARSSPCSIITKLMRNTPRARAPRQLIRPHIGARVGGKKQDLTVPIAHKPLGRCILLC